METIHSIPVREHDVRTPIIMSIVSDFIYTIFFFKIRCRYIVYGYTKDNRAEKPAGLLKLADDGDMQSSKIRFKINSKMPYIASMPAIDEMKRIV